MKLRIVFPPCNSCGLCREVCPESAIRPTLLEPRHLYEIIPEKCTGCGECLDQLEIEAARRKRAGHPLVHAPHERRGNGRVDRSNLATNRFGGSQRRLLSGLTGPS